MDISLKDFLKKYSTISNKFIDDFFGLYDYNTTSTDHVIELSIIIRWLKIRRDSIIDTLKRSYIINVDYKIKKQSTKGRPLDVYYITPDCFKRLCMMTRTEKGEEVRTYFLELEKLIDKYKNIIIDNLLKQIDILKNNQKPIEKNKQGVIYVIKTTMDAENIFKIGKSKNFKERYLSHNSSHADNLEVILLYDTKHIDDIEKCIKLAIKSKQYRKRKEIYQIDLDILKEIIEDCEKLILKGRRRSKIKDIKKGGYYIYLDKTQN